ncbi:MAG TPA: ribonuclease PH [Polyangiaceae bacterium LLY-WYZ-15_(1-7)]|nr:ribonuclease PH [Myxococcales bacterium]MAT29437.1 ribonuclease PH [Sandaracinus sp.]HJK92385.1 ribonuclease PH [Polyangiaceae bacterium LLY-WYZ-15_(1-7)]MBJ73394.1 ribonuclease PH [Sandaracinus sp.]HJL01471.1 ribonuclease PH [Polyangiaceae bacterium LLY-WYZ-15_(1-7)]
MTREDGRGYDALRPVTVETAVQRNPEGSVLYRCGGTTVLVSASVEESAPPWLKEGHGWLTAEYAMHPRANDRRQRREGMKGRVSGRTAEIQRLIGRALRAAVHLDRLGSRQIVVDCDVLDADGGTRTASVTGGFIATAMALHVLRQRGLVPRGILREPVAAISVGLVNDKPMLDLCYVEDRDASVDLNVVGTTGGAFVEVQGTAEGAPVPRPQLDAMLDLALGAMPRLVDVQKEALVEAGVDLGALLGK